MRKSDKLIEKHIFFNNLNLFYFEPRVIPGVWRSY